MKKSYAYYSKRTGDPKKAKRKYAKYLAKRVSIKQPPKVRHFYLYGLELEDGKYYVGVTSYKDALRRYQEHCDGKGAKWTKLHTPVQLIEARSLGVCTHKMAIEAENLMTRDYMEKYGMYNVRGGDLCYISPTLVALHYNDHLPIKRVTFANGSRSHKYVKQARLVQEQIAEELSWIV
jgi:predicted GIY-YIG superfamily endonuclease